MHGYWSQNSTKKNHVQTMRYARPGPKREFRFILHSNFPSLDFPQLPKSSFGTKSGKRKLNASRFIKAWLKQLYAII